jgi:hypothetical protein
MSGEVYFSSLRTPDVQRGMVMVELYGPDRMTDVQVVEIPPEVMTRVIAGARGSGRCLRCELLARLAGEPGGCHSDGDLTRPSCAM